MQTQNVAIHNLNQGCHKGWMYTMEQTIYTVATKTRGGKTPYTHEGIREDARPSTQGRASDLKREESYFSK